MVKRPNRTSNSRVIPVKQVSKFTIGDGEILRQRIAKGACTLYERRGCCDGRDLDDRLQAEQLVLAELAKTEKSKKPGR